MATKRELLGFFVWELGDTDCSVVYTQAQLKDYIKDANNEHTGWRFYDLKKHEVLASSDPVTPPTKVVETF